MPDYFLDDLASILSDTCDSFGFVQ